MITCEHCKHEFNPDSDMLSRHKLNVRCPKCGEWTTENERTLKRNLFGYRGKRNYNDPSPEATSDY